MEIYLINKESVQIVGSIKIEASGSFCSTIF